MASPGSGSSTRVEYSAASWHSLLTLTATLDDLGIDHATIRRVLETGLPEQVQVSDTEAELELRESIARYGIASSLMLPLLSRGSAVVGLDFDATVAWPAYDWMGVAKAGLESSARYLARELGPHGVRVNLVAAGPLRTMAAKSIPGFPAASDLR